MQMSKKMENEKVIENEIVLSGGRWKDEIVWKKKLKEYETSKSMKSRHEALHDAIRAEGYKTIVRRLVAVSNYNKKTAPIAHDIMRADIKWAQEQMKPKYNYKIILVSL